jgi:hypothetical protein
MSLAALMARDVSAILLRTGDGAEAGTYIPAEQGEDGPGFACVLRLGTDTTGIVVEDLGEHDNRRDDALGDLAAIMAGILAATGVARNPRRGDAWRCPSGGHAGRWIVDDATPHGQGAVTLRLRLETTLALAAPGVRGRRA